MDLGETHLWTQQVKVLYGEELSGVDSSSTWFMSVTRLWASLLSAVYRRIFSSFLAVSPMDCAILRLQSLMGEKFSVKCVAVLKSSLSFGHELLSCYRLFPTERPTWKCAKLWLWPQTLGTMLRSLQTLTVKLFFKHTISAPSTEMNMSEHKHLLHPSHWSDWSVWLRLAGPMVCLSISFKAVKERL